MARILNLTFLFLTFYLASYAFLVEPTPQSIFINIKKGEFLTQPKYRFLSDHEQTSQFAGKFYQPLHTLDTKIRPEYWRSAMLGFNEPKV